MRSISEIRKKAVKISRLSNPKLKDLCLVLLELIGYIEEREVN